MGQRDSKVVFPFDSRPSESSMIASHTVNGGPLSAGFTSPQTNSTTVSELRVRLAGMLMFDSAALRGTNKQVSFRTDGSSAFAANVYFAIEAIDIKLDVRVIPELPPNESD